jgi:hypothetical protein
LKTVDAPHLDHRRYNHPTASEVAIVMVGNGEDGATERDLVIQARDGGFRSISYLKSFYIPLRYPIPFVFGQQGWHPNIYLQDGLISILSLKATWNSNTIVGTNFSNSRTKDIQLISYKSDQLASTRFTVVVACFRNTASISLHKLNKNV